MLQQFSWTQFLLTYLVITIGWYLGFLFTLYRKDLVSLFSVTLSSQDKPEHLNSPARNHLAGCEDGLMGKSVAPEGLEMVSTSTLNFATPVSSGYDKNSRSDQIGLIPDVIQELKEIFQVLADEDGTKKDFLNLAGLIGEKYGRIGSNPNISHINTFIREQAPFAISSEELENLWS